MQSLDHAEISTYPNPLSSFFSHCITASLQCNSSDPPDEETGHEQGGESPESNTDCTEQVAAPDWPRCSPAVCKPCVQSCHLCGEADLVFNCHMHAYCRIEGGTKVTPGAYDVDCTRVWCCAADVLCNTGLIFVVSGNLGS